MLFLAIFFFFFVWAILVIRKGRLTWHSIVCLYFIVLVVSDFADVASDDWFDFYTILARLLDDPYADNHLAVIISDGFIFPCIGIIFCYYASRYKRPWLLTLAFSALLGVVELILVGLGSMLYHCWYFWTTGLLSIVVLRILAKYAARLVGYNPPVSYKTCIFCVVFAISEWPGAVLGGVLRLYQFRPFIFQNENGDDRIVAMALALSVGILSANLVTRIPPKYRIIFFSGLGVLSALFGIFAHWTGVMLYNNWSTAATIVRYVAPYGLIWLYDRWETKYREKLKLKN